MPVSLDRLKAQLLTSGLQQENFALYQVIYQLVDYLTSQTATTNQTFTGSSGGGGGAGLVGATYLTQQKEVGLPNSLQTIPGAGIQFNDAGGKRIISTAIPFGMDSGEEGLEGPPGPPGRIGIDGVQGSEGSPGLPGIDGEDGIDGDPGSQGPQGTAGLIGLTGETGAPGIDGMEGEIGEWGIQGPQGNPGLTGGNGGLTFWFDPTDASDIAGYKKALISPSPNAESTDVTVCAGVGDNLLHKFVTEPGIPGVYWIEPGACFRHIHGAVTTVGGFARYKVEAYYCNADGSGETLIGSSYSDSTTDTSIDEVNFDLYQITRVVLLPTQRLVWYLYVARVSGPANVSVTTYYEGLVHPSYVGCNVSAGAVGPRGPAGMIGPPGYAAPIPEPEEPEYPYMIPGPTGATGKLDWDITLKKIGNDTVNNSTTLADDSELQTTSLALSSVYIMEWWVIYSGNNATGDYKFQFRLGGNVVITAQWGGYNVNANNGLGVITAAQISTISGNDTLFPAAVMVCGTDAADSKIVNYGRAWLATPSAWAGDGKFVYKFALSSAAVGRICTTYAGSIVRLKKLL